MKLSIALNTLQLLVIAVLLIKVINVEDQLQALQPDNAIATPASQSQLPVGSNIAPATQPADGQANRLRNTNQPGPTLEQIRAMLRQELSLLTAPAATTELPAVTDPQNLIDQQLQLDLVMQELDFYINQGVISDQEMSHLQLEIAKLDPSGKQQAMSQLVKAINSGQLEGRL